MVSLGLGSCPKPVPPFQHVNSLKAVSPPPSHTQCSLPQLDMTNTIQICMVPLLQMPSSRARRIKKKPKLRITVGFRTCRASRKHVDPVLEPPGRWQLSRIGGLPVQGHACR